MTTADLGKCFARASAYAPAHMVPGAVRERESGRWAFPYSERHVQCVWFDNALRPDRLVTSEGESVEVEDPGVWNLEAGPDFLGAALRIGPDRRRMVGDVEVHIHPTAWRQHGHADDPRYARVRVHVTYFPGALPASEFPPGTTQIALRDALAARPDFSFDNVELTAYPFATRAPVPPCFRELESWSADRKHALLDAAGEERLRRKAVRFVALSSERGLDQALYEEAMAALGYKQNKPAFRRLASAVPLERLRSESGGDPIAAFALLAGVSGLLPPSPSPRWDAESRSFARRVWDAWWKRRDRFVHAALPRSTWSLAGVRPANHPLRRLMAAARLFTAAPPVSKTWSGSDLAGFLAQFSALRDGYFDRRATLGGRRFTRTAALIGPDRAEALAVNVWIPFLAATRTGPLRRTLLDALPPEADHAILRQTALNLFGPNHPPSLYRTGLRRQGLVQIFHDYCLNDRSRCAACSFPALLARHKAESASSGEST